MLRSLETRLFRPADSPEPPEPAPAVTREMVVWAYRRLLGRDPDSDAVIAEAIRLGSPLAILDLILDSDEFAARGVRHMDRFAPPPDVAWQAAPDILAALLERISATWQHLGEECPYWSVLSGPEYAGEDTPERRQAFYDSGSDDLRVLLATLARLGRRPAEFPVLFEFGCGLGRVTTHLCGEFARVIACDASPSHLALASDALRRRGLKNAELKLATPADFGMSEPCDLWFSRIVLQHNPPPLIAAIIERALATLRPRGLAIFQVPVYLPGYRFNIEEYLQQPVDRSRFDMHLLPQLAVLEIAERQGCRLREIREDNSAGEQWISQFFAVEKR